MEFLTLLGLIIPIGVVCLIFWPKREPPDYDWKSCVKRAEEKEKRRKERRRKIKDPQYTPDFRNSFLLENMWFNFDLNNLSLSLSADDADDD